MGTNSYLRTITMQDETGVCCTIPRLVGEGADMHFEPGNKLPPCIPPEAAKATIRSAR